MTAYRLVDLHGRDHVVDGVVRRDGLLFATMPENGGVPSYSIKYNHEFRRYYKDHIKNNENIRDGGPSDNQGDACRPS